MISLYQFATSPFTEKVRRALAYRGIAFKNHQARRLSFGAGPHVCIGPQLARTQLKLQLNEIVTRIPDICMSAPPHHLRTIWFNSIINHRDRAKVDAVAEEITAPGGAALGRRRAWPPRDQEGGRLQQVRHRPVPARERWGVHVLTHRRTLFNRSANR